MGNVPDVDWVEEHLQKDGGGFVRAGWDAIGARILAGTDEAVRNATFDAAAQLWLHRCAESIGPEYRVLKSRNFLMVAPGLEGEEATLFAFLEHARKTILDTVPGLARDEGYGRNAVLLFGSREDYESYVEWFFDKRDAGALTGGMYIHDGYGHLLLPWSELVEAERCAAHELSHACVAHLAMPAWLNEGIACAMEGVLTGASRNVIRGEEVMDQRECWSAPGGIQRFWAGRSFHDKSDAFFHGYGLAYLMVKILSHDYARFREFVLSADPGDAGEAALRRLYGGSLGDVVTQVLGPGDWTPQPGSWSEESSLDGEEE